MSLFQPSLQSSLVSLPNELVDAIISCLSLPPPSLAKLHQPPSSRITTSTSRDLKNLSRTSSRIRELVLPRLFAHACFKIQEVPGFLAFVAQRKLSRHVVSIVAKGVDPLDEQENRYWWRPVLDCLNPLRLTVLASPPLIAAMLDTRIVDEHSWAFEVPFQILQLEQTAQLQAPSVSPAAATGLAGGLLRTRAWSSLAFNESSALRAYNHYEYFLFQFPSIFHRWGCFAYLQPLPEEISPSLSLTSLTSFRYTAVFPFYNHVKLVLDTVGFMTNLRSFSVQLAPGQDDKTTELEQRGSLDPSDPWMEIATGYSLIAHAVRDLGNKAQLVKFSTRDFDFDALRPELSAILRDVLENCKWVHSGHGTWIREPVEKNNSGPTAEQPSLTPA
ncbi:hypothetical protein BO70DRAFT_7628 [Aspergillus heteromorphus CBS 117.55]|uniref:F-box domain-containing protein n=1 Tax=Aspergillus heteromorphus CBS 117.55 TaxID=1448321 RepID=A0A317X5Y8_9EURO|nr:uncharacterized protein BO70DRAFT_7628 [Aspergillus heteromorphus CBS 117.55]PWY92338.1 hypothetical protein BO70DRAFT_7628 [Aspergillus heteromorphus CBS 117.55]